MPSMTDLLVKDDAATPKEWTLKPLSDANGVQVWRSDDPNLPIMGQLTYTLTTTKLRNGQGYKVSGKLEVPVMETLGASGSAVGYVAPPKVAYVDTVIVSRFAPARSTKQDRANTVRMALGIIQGASSTTATGTLTNASAGQAWLNSTSMGSTAFIGLMPPN